MPANLTPQYHEAERRYREASTDRERLAALKEMLRLIPKHKGTDKLQADIKRRIANINDLIQREGKSGRKQFSYYVKKEGLPQVALVGAPNTGKSQLIAALTNAHPEIAGYPYTTRMVLPGVLIHENFHIQLIDLPPVSDDYMEYWVPEVIKHADAALLIVDLGAEDVLEQIETVIQILEKHRIFLSGEDVEVDPYRAEYHLKTILAGNKSDIKIAPENWEVIAELYEARFPLCPISAKALSNLEEIKQALISLLDIIRVYSKPPGKEASKERPFILKRGSTLKEFAIEVHHDFADKLKFARVWGHTKFDGQKVNRDYVLEDEDIIELHL
ncbi:TGS domain-containing protein [candidate division KSB1 bacterium]|nr:TGS domain-containing protein [candidate division KSB1 bacterium]